MARIRIGLSGWNYPHWRGTFYPKSLARTRELGYIAERFETVELNTTFYRLANPDTFRRWYRSVPAGFVFSVKGGRFITHNKKLVGVDSALANFFASGVLELDDKLGPVLWQLPANLHFQADRIEQFLGSLPRTTTAAVALAERHDDRVRNAAFGPGRHHRLRHVLEVRHASYLCDELVAIARRHGIALAFSHASTWPYLEEITAGFVYVRLHGPGELYASAYGSEAVRAWADRLRTWHHAQQPDDAVQVTGRVPPPRKGRDVYVYFDNDGHGHAPREASYLRAVIGGG